VRKKGKEKVVSLSKPARRVIVQKFQPLADEKPGEKKTICVKPVRAATGGV